MKFTVIETLPGHPEDTLTKTYEGDLEGAKEWALRTVYFYKGVISIYDDSGKKVF